MMPQLRNENSRDNYDFGRDNNDAPASLQYDKDNHDVARENQDA